MLFVTPLSRPILTRLRAEYHCPHQNNLPSQLTMSTTTTTSEDKYLLDRDALASARLRLQHFAIIQLQHWYLPPDVETYLQSLDRPRVLDLATGNGIWATELADRYPQMNVTGLDISDSQFPSAAETPENVSFAVHDAFNAVPEHYIGAFDSVHLRLTVGWIYNHNAEELLRNALKMLKPGGYLQWEENVGPDADRPHDGIWHIKPDGSFERAWPSWLRVLSSPALLTAFHWLQDLPARYKSFGLSEIQVHRPQPRKAILRTQVEVLRWTVAEVHGTMISTLR